MDSQSNKKAKIIINQMKNKKQYLNQKTDTKFFIKKTAFEDKQFLKRSLLEKINIENQTFLLNKKTHNLQKNTYLDNKKNLMDTRLDIVNYMLKKRMADFLSQELKNSNNTLTKQKNKFILKQIEEKHQQTRELFSDKVNITNIIEIPKKKSNYLISSTRAKVAITASLSLTGVVAVANIPTENLVSQERIVENLNIHLNIITEKNINQSYMQVAHIDKKDTLSSLFNKLGIEDIQAENFVTNNPLAKFLMQVKPDYKVIAEVSENKELISLKTIIHSTRSNAVWLHIAKSKEGNFSASKHIIGHKTDLEVSSGALNSNDFFASMANEGVPDNVIKQMINIFSTTVNFHYDFKKGDKFRLVYERHMNENEFIGHGKVIAAEIINNKGTHQAIWYPKSEEYYTFNGEALKRSFLQSPLEITNVTSNFGMRHHPIHGYSHQHTGVDFAAPLGTPVFASADGIVEFVGMQNGYGKIVILKHDKGITTYYAHLSNFNHIKPGQLVKQGEEIAYVGKTGSATGYHLHYEYRVNNSPLNPLAVIGEASSTLSAENKQDFITYTQDIMKQVQALRNFDINNKI